MFHIDYTINPWINTYDLERDQTMLNNILNIGYSVLKHINIKTDSSSQVLEFLQTQEKMLNNNVELIKNKVDSTDKIFEIRMDAIQETISEITDKSNKCLEQQMNRFYDIVEKITGKSHTSSTKGKIAEHFLEETLSELYPEDRVVTTALSAHEADIQLYSDEHQTILIESKNYSNTIPTKEVEKFKTDLDRTNIQYGIFYSFNSSITGKHKFQVENYKDKWILYCPNIQFDQNIIALSVLFIRKIAKINKATNQIDRNIISQKINEIVYILKDLDLLYENLSKTKYELIKSRKTISDSLDAIYVSYIENENTIKQIVDRIKKTIDEKLDGLATEYLAEHTRNIDMDKLRSGTKVDILLYHLFQMTSNKLDIREETGKYNFYKQDQLIAEVSTKKTGIRVSIAKPDIQFNIAQNAIKELDVVSHILNTVV
jgi:hypothetical protein